ncbi:MULTISPECIES: hypothetical protein [unclassified Bradyrhizobium]|uniref:hypothetical protein n=1 Tax=unclassified Bradyrhizobium TaxID=2631580 RepID=UPI002916ADB7|nr:MULTISPECIES: hypothetical protein [unclassified Bradyrhizobium]
MSAETFYEEPQVIDVLISFDEDRTTNDLIVKREQEIPDWWLAEMANLQTGTLDRSGDFLHVAAVPCIVVDDLRVNYGFDVMNAPIAETVAMLRRYALDKFILTSKRI